MNHAFCKTLCSLVKGTSFEHHSAIHRAGTPGLLILAALVGSTTVVFGQMDLPHPLFTWSLSPVNGQWNNSANWTPAGVPDDQSERAAFGSSSITTVTASGQEIHSVDFNPGASQFNIMGDLVFNG